MCQAVLSHILKKDKISFRLCEKLKKITNDERERMPVRSWDKTGFAGQNALLSQPRFRMLFAEHMPAAFSADAISFFRKSRIG